MQQQPQPAVTEKEYLAILHDIIITKKIKGKKQIRETLKNVIHRCVANRQNFDELSKKCVEIVLSSKEYEQAAIKENEEAQERLRRKTEFVS
jgi:hypothetical protein